MAGIAGGSFRPVFGHPGADRAVAKFALDTVPVSEAEFLGFVKQHQRWAKENVPALFADRNYLQGVRGGGVTEWTRDFKPMDRSMTCAAGALQTGDPAITPRSCATVSGLPGRHA